MVTQMSAILPNFAGFTISRGSFHLRLLEQLGSGAYGVVYVAQDLAPRPHGARYYAVKCLLRHPDNSDMARQQHRELAHHRAVSGHPNVVTLHATIEEDFYTFLVLDLCDGGDLFTAIMERDTYANNNAAVKHTFLQIIDAVAACHELGIYHRDLKPENILCSRDDRHVYLADFGLSTRSKRSVNFGCGSSFYMSPECLGIYRKKTPYLTKPSDIWALGTILCNLLTGRNPWHIASPKTDDGFRLYVRDGPAWLHKNLPISAAAAHILGRTFDLNPLTRISIPDLRAAVLATDSFFPGASTSPSSLFAAAAEDERTPRARQGSWELAPIRATPTISADFVAMSLGALAGAGMSATLAGAGTTSTFVNDNAIASADTDPGADDVWSLAGPPPLTVSPRSSSDASADSEGPVTPETRPADADVVESDFELDDGDAVDDGRVRRRKAHAKEQVRGAPALSAVGRVAGLKMDKRFTRSLGRLVSGMRIKRVNVRA